MSNANSVSGSSVGDFPVWALQPRAETGGTAFANKYPDYDGRGTIIAILDSGEKMKLKRKKNYFHRHPH